MKIKFFLSLFFILLFTSKSFCQENTIDSLFFLETRKNIKKMVVLKNYKEAITLSKELIKKRINKNKLAKDYYRLGYCFKKNNQLDSAYYYYIKSRNLFSNNTDTLQFAKQQVRIAKFESDQELYNKSDSSAISALKYLKKDNKLKSSIYNCLGINSRNKKEYSEALKWYDLAITTTSDSIKKLRYLNNQAFVYIDFKNYTNAVFNYNQIKNNKYYDSIPLHLKVKIIDNEAFVRFLDNQKIEESEFLNTQAIKQKINDQYGLLANYSYLSDFHKKENRNKGLQYAYKMYELTKKINRPKDRIEALDKIINLEEDSKIRKLAEERNILSDSLQLAKQQSQNKFAKIIYNYEEEEKQKLKAQVALEKQKSQKTKIIFSSVILLILFVLYLIYKHQKSKKEKVIEVYKTEIRLAKKIHDELANYVYLVMNKAQDVNVTSIELLPDLEKIYALTRDISHENSLILTGNVFEEFLGQLLSEFNKNGCKVFTKGLKNVTINKLTKEKQIVVYRVLQELLINMKKHSKATLVGVTFSEKNGLLSINYKDNGIGVSSLKRKNGIQNMDTRIKSINGLFSFDSEEGKGFEANVQFKK